MVQNGGVRIDPKLLALSSGQARPAAQASGAGNVALALQKQAQARQEFENQDWDPVLRPVQQIFNALTAGGSGVMNAIDKGIKGGIEGGAIGAVGGTVGGLVNGFFASFNNDPKSENYMTGSKLIESATDRFGNAYNRNYKDVEDNVNPVAKATLGFVGDVALDPLTYVPGGIFASAARGAVRGAKSAEGLGKIGAAAKGVVEGVPDAVKLGRFTNTVKPIGLQQWKQTREYNKFGKIQRKAGISEELMFAITAPNGVARFTEEILPQLRKDNGEDYLPQLTPQRVQEIADKAAPLLPNYTRVASGAEGARAVAKTEAPPEGSVGYRYGDKNGVKTPPVAIRKNAADRAAAVKATMASKKALTETEIRKLDAENALNLTLKQVEEKTAARDGLVKGLEEANKRAVKTDTAAQIAAREVEVAEMSARIDGLNREIRSAQRVIKTQTDFLNKNQQEMAQLADTLGVAPDARSLAEHLQKAQAYLTETGINHGGIIGLATPAHRELWKIDAEQGLTEGATQTLLGALRAALTPDANGVAAVDDMIIGSVAGIPFGLRAAIDEFYGGGSELLLDTIPDSPAKTAMIEFYSGVIDGVLNNIWDISRNSFYKATEEANVAVARAGLFEELAQEAAAYSAKTVILNAQDIIHSSQMRLDALNALPAAERKLDAEEIKRLTALMRQSEENIRYIENGGPEEMTPFVFNGAIDAAAEAARTAGLMASKAGPKEALVILQNIDTVKAAIAKLDAEAPTVESANGSASFLLGKLIEAHSAMDESVKRIAAITGDSKNPIKALIDIVTGVWRPSEDMLSDPDSFGKLIIELAKLPIEIPGVSDLARLRARAFADAEGLGVYGLSEELENYAVGAYGREMMRNFQSSGAIIDDSAGVMDTVEDIVSRQEIPSEAFSPREGSVGFGVGEDTVTGVQGDGPLAALDLFGYVVARGINEDELLRNLEIYRSTRLTQIASAYTGNVEAAILGRKAHFSGEPVEAFTAWWDGEIQQFTTPPVSANIFQTPVDKPIRGKGTKKEPMVGVRRRILDNDEKELDAIGTRLFTKAETAEPEAGSIGAVPAVDPATGKPYKATPGDKLRGDAVPEQASPETPKNLSYYEGKKGLPLRGDGTPEINAKFRELNPYTKAKVSPAEHILGYAKAPLDILDWVKLIHIAASGTKYSGEYFGRYRAVADKLKIPYGEKTFIVNGAARSMVPHIQDGDVINAYNKYVAEFDRTVNKEAAASVEIKVSEWKKAKGMDGVPKKKEFKELRTVASENYGVDPLGRTIRGERQAKKSGDEWGDYAWLSKFPENEDTIKAILGKAGSESQALAALQNALSEGDAALVIPLAINSWGKIGKYGYTPESARAIISLRQSIAGSPIGIRAALEEMAPSISVTRENEKSLAVAVAEAREALAAAGNPRWVRTETMKVKYVPIGERVDRAVVGEMVNPQSRFGAAIQSMDVTLKPGKDGAKPQIVSNRRPLNVPEDETITGMPDKQTEEVRDWATGGVKERDVKADKDYPMFDSFDDVTVREIKTLLGLPEIEAEQLIKAAAFAAKKLVEIAPDGTKRLKVTPQQYAERMMAAITARVRELDAEQPTSTIAEARIKGSAADKFDKLINEGELTLANVLNKPEFRDLLEKVLEIAPYHALKVDELGNPIYGTSRYTAQSLKSTKPVETFAGFLESIDAIVGRHYGAPNSGMVERLDNAGEAARLLQINSAGHSNLVAESVNAKNVRQFFSKAESDIIAAIKPIDDTTVMFGGEIVQRSARVTPEQQLEQIAIDTAKAKEKAVSDTTAPLANALEARLRDTIRKSIAKAAKDKSGKYGSFGNDTARTATHDVLQELDRAARVLGASPAAVANIKKYALMIYREEAQKLGLNPITSLAKNNMGRIKYEINRNVDWMYTGYNDVIMALEKAGQVSAVTRMLSEIMPETGRVIRGVETGLIFPPNVISEMGVLSVRLHAAGIAQNDIQAAIYHSLITSLETMPKGYFREILEGVTFATPHGVNAARLAEYSAALANPRFAEFLKEAHTLNGAYAYTAADGISSRISQAALDRIAEVRTGAQYGLDDIVQTIITSTPKIRSAIEAQGFPADSLVAHLAKGKVQQALNGTFTPTEIGIARTSARMDQAAKQAKKDGSNYQQVMSTERANLAAQRIKLADELTARNAIIRINELIEEATPESIQAAYETGIAGLESSMAASVALANFLLGGPAYAGLVKTAKTEKELLAAGILTAEQKRNAAASRLQDLKNTKKTVQDARLIAMRREIVSTVTSTTKGARDKQNSLNKIDAELKRLEKQAEALRPEASRFDTSTLASDVPRETLSSFADNSKGFAWAERFSGQAGKGDTYHTAAARETAIDNNINSWEAQAEDLFMDMMRFFGANVSRVPAKGFEDTEFAEQSAKALELGNELMDRLIVKGESLESVLKRYPNPREKAIATKWNEVYRYLFDREGLAWLRAGLDSNWINGFIEGSPFGKTQYAKLLMGLNGRDLYDNVISNIAKLLEAPTGAGGADWLTIGKGYSWVFQRASMVPTIAAEYSARFGNKADGLSHAEAFERGYKAITSDGTLAQFLDKEQLYPPYYLRQLANMERFFNTDISVHAKWVKGLDKATGAIKSSITLWRPGHHVVNMMGETFMNVLAGVVNPVRYAQAWKVMRSVDEFGAGNVFGRNATIPLDDFTNSYKMEAFTGSNGSEGIKILVGGKERVVPFAEFYKMMNQKGILLNNNTAEDIIVQGDNIMGSQNRMSGVLGDLQRANEGLGAFSARRDNFFRIAHAIHIASKKTHRSVPSMVDDITREVMEYHPTMQMLSPFERKYMRRVMYFYTWQRNAISVIMRTMFENPANFTILPKFIYETSTIGGDPESIGQPMPNDPRLAGFAAANNLGPHWIDEAGNVVGITLNAPQLDIFNTLMGGLYYDPTQNAVDNVSRNLGYLLRENTIGQAAPGINIPIELAMQSTYSARGPQPIEDYGDYLIDKTGLGYISRIAGVGLINNQGFLGARTDQKTEGERGIAAGNALTGLRWTEWSKWYETAQREREARNKVAQDELAKKLGIMP